MQASADYSQTSQKCNGTTKTRKYSSSIDLSRLAPSAMEWQTGKIGNWGKGGLGKGGDWGKWNKGGSRLPPLFQLTGFSQPPNRWCFFFGSQHGSQTSFSTVTGTILQAVYFSTTGTQIATLRVQGTATWWGTRTV
jgi:hypothetical protein